MTAVVAAAACRRAGVRASVAMVTAAGMVGAAPAAAAPADGCPATEVVFARGTDEPPGVGRTGQAFIDALASRVGETAVYPVAYPATNQWQTAVDGIRDAGAYVVSRVGECPQTMMVLGGYSQGAAVIGFVTSSAVPDGIDPATVPKPLDPEVAEHVAAVVLFAAPNDRAMNFLGEPRFIVGPLYRDKTIELCAAEDLVCSDGMNFTAHNSYADDVETLDRAADFAAARLPG